MQSGLVKMGDLVANQKGNLNNKNIVPRGLQGVQNVNSLVEAFLQAFEPLEASMSL